jgi:uncharacterized protein with PIN domain
MKTAIFDFHDALSDFLPKDRRGPSVVRNFKGAVSVKHLIESQGIPHTEVQYIRVNGTPVTFDYLVCTGDRISVYPPRGNEEWDGGSSLLRPLSEPYLFLLDNHLGRLATYLRLLGFDAQYDRNLDDAELARISHQEDRILLTRDRGLLMRRLVKYGYCVRTRDPKSQLRAVILRFDLASQARPWQRCLHCNGRLLPVSKDIILDRLEPRTIKYYDEFHRCQSCDKIYWKGSHYLRMKRFLDELEIPE